ncbi:hypothetical protein Tco_0966162 [Tanacetum coccineum]
MLVEALESGQILDEEQLAFLTDPGILDSQAAQTTIPNNDAFQTEDLDAYDSDCDDVLNAKAVLMANLSSYGSDVISEDFEQTPVGDFSDNEITSDRNIILYSQYLQETQHAAVHNTNLYAQQDSIILSVIEQKSEQMINHKAQRIEPTLYDGSVISSQHVAMPLINDDETLILEEESRSKMSKQVKDPETIKQNISHKPIDYVKLNQLSEDFGKCFVPQQELSIEQAFWFHMSNPSTESSVASPVKVEVSHPAKAETRGITRMDINITQWRLYREIQCINVNKV